MALQMVVEMDGMTVGNWAGLRAYYLVVKTADCWADWTAAGRDVRWAHSKAVRWVEAKVSMLVVNLVAGKTASTAVS